MAKTKNIMRYPHTTIRLPPALAEWAQDHAKANGTNRSNYIRQLLLADARRQGRKFTKDDLTGPEPASVFD